MKGILDLIKIVAIGAMIMVIVYMLGIFALVAMAIH
jgi:hypothetical protein